MASADGNQLVGPDRHDLVRVARGIAGRVVGWGRIRHPPMGWYARMRMMRRGRCPGVARIILGRVHTFGRNRRRRPMRSWDGMASQTFGKHASRRLSMMVMMRMMMMRMMRWQRHWRSLVVRRPRPRSRVRRMDVVGIQYPALRAVQRRVGVLLTTSARRR